MIIKDIPYIKWKVLEEAYLQLESKHNRKEKPKPQHNTEIKQKNVTKTQPFTWTWSSFSILPYPIDKEHKQGAKRQQVSFSLHFEVFKIYAFIKIYKML